MTKMLRAGRWSFQTLLAVNATQVFTRLLLLLLLLLMRTIRRDGAVPKHLICRCKGGGGIL
jgi:hypothetical protein